MNAADLDELAGALRRERDLRLADVSDTEEDLRAMAEEREAELEEAAQEDRTARLLVHLDDRGRSAIEAINQALDRIADGTYGICIDCGEGIPLERLRAVPTALRCVECTERREGRTTAPLPDRSRRDPSAADVARLDDDELATAVREALARDGRIDLQELEVQVRDGVVHLRGALPSESELDRVRKIVTDVVGVPDLDDRVNVDGVAWQRPDRSRAEPAIRDDTTGEVSAIDPAGAAPELEDVVHSVNEGVGWRAPDAPVPDEQEP